MEWLGLPITDWGAGTLVVAIVILILTDRLVPRSRLIEERNEKKIAQAHSAKQLEINGELSLAVKAHNEAALLQERVMRAVQEHHQLNQSDGEHP